jgi:hypothetical protein
MCPEEGRDLGARELPPPAYDGVSFGESAVADEGGDDRDKGCEVVGSAFVAAV